MIEWSKIQNYETSLKTILQAAIRLRYFIQTTLHPVCSLSLAWVIYNEILKVKERFQCGQVADFVGDRLNDGTRCCGVSSSQNLLPCASIINTWTSSSCFSQSRPKKLHDLQAVDFFDLAEAFKIDRHLNNWFVLAAFYGLANFELLWYRYLNFLPSHRVNIASRNYCSFQRCQCSAHPWQHASHVSRCFIVCRTSE